MTSRAVAFSWVMALFPTLVAFVSVYGLAADAAHARDHLALLAGVLPASSLSLLENEMLRIAALTEARLSLALATGVAIAFWTANTGMGALLRGLDLAYDHDEERRSWRVGLAASALTLTAFALLTLITAALVLAPLSLSSAFGLAGWSPFTALRWPLLFGLAVLLCELLYRFGPAQPLWRWRWISAGSAMTATLWLSGSAAFSWYVRAGHRFADTYGSLGAIFAVLIWIWLTALMILLGARLNAEIEHEVVRARPAFKSRRRRTGGDSR